jgi:hypothetical protein
MGENDSSFTVKDRRRFSDDGQVRTDVEDAEKTVADAQPREDEAAEAPDQAKRNEPRGQEAPRGLPPVDFGSFILSLTHAALMHMGQTPDPYTGKAMVNLEVARHTIDTIAMLQEKTKGNLDQDEQHLIDNALSQLRMIFVKVKSGDFGQATD